LWILLSTKQPGGGRWDGVVWCGVWGGGTAVNKVTSAGGWGPDGMGGGGAGVLLLHQESDHSWVGGRCESCGYSCQQSNQGGSEGGILPSKSNHGGGCSIDTFSSLQLCRFRPKQPFLVYKFLKYTLESLPKFRYSSHYSRTKFSTHCTPLEVPYLGTEAFSRVLNLNLVPCYPGPPADILN
jgi:hypothetical protein